MGAEEAFKKNDESKAKVDGGDNVSRNDGRCLFWCFRAEKREGQSSSETKRYAESRR